MFFMLLITSILILLLHDRKFAPRCSVCGQAIMPEPGQEETVRIVALDRSFHVDCYVCEVALSTFCIACNNIAGSCGDYSILL